MAKICSVCAHEKRALIDKKLLARTNHRAIAREFGIAKSNLGRHIKNHLQKDIARVEAARPARIGREFETLLKRNKALSLKAERAGNIPAAILANREVRVLLEYQAKLSGFVAERAQTNVSLSVIDPATALRMAEIYVQRHGGGNKLLEGKL